MHPKSRRIADLLRDLGVDTGVVEVPDSTRTAAEAAQAIGTTVAQIAKSLVFTADAGPVLVIASGTNRVDTSRVRQLIGAPIERPDGKTVKKLTGFSIGGVPPLGHATEPRTLIDADLLDYDVVWAAAGTPNSVFPIAPAELVRVTGGQVADVCERP